MRVHAWVLSMLVGLASCGSALGQVGVQGARMEGTATASRTGASREAVPRAAPADLLGKITRPPTHRELLDSLLASPGTKAVLDAAAQSAGVPPFQPGTGDTLPSGGGTWGISGTPIENLPWKTGIRFTPASPGPMHLANGRNYRVATLYSQGAILMPGVSLADMHQQDVAYLLPPCQARLFLDLPSIPGTYLIAFQIAHADKREIINWSAADAALVSAVVWKPGTNEPDTKLQLANLATQPGFVAVCTIAPNLAAAPTTLRTEAQQFWNMRRVVAVVNLMVAPSPQMLHVWQPDAIVFGGFTVQRLL